LLSSILSLTATIVSFGPVLAAEDAMSGEQIYRAKCARCHGSSGEGTKKNDKPLVGDRSVAQLAELIAETMPEDDAGSLSESEARAAAEYIHGAFYSPVAQARNQPPRIETSRLTARQYRRSLADLIGSFRPATKWSDQRGLEGSYHQGRNIGGRRSRAAERIDPQIDFDFGVEAPLEAIAEPREFSIRWEGAILAPETGEYEFVARTEHAARLWVNDLNSPLVDAWVKSGSETDHKASVYLVAGHVYPVRFDFTKAKLGVNDSDEKKKKRPSAPASIALLWKRPRGSVEPIPSQNLSPQLSPEVYICSTPLPPDDRSLGWVRGASVSKAWNEATTTGAVDAARYVVAYLKELSGAPGDGPERTKKLRSFCRTFAQRAFRRPLTEEQAAQFIDRQFSAVDDDETAVKRVVLLVLLSPRFLFRETQDEPDPYSVAERLAFGLWDSLPDEPLRKAAAEGKLATDKEIKSQAERMSSDVRAKTKLREFLLAWLGVDAERDLGKNAREFPGFDAQLVADLRTSLELFLDDVIASDQADYRSLLLSPDVFMNERLAKFYGVEHSQKAQFVKVALDGGKRAGVLTHPYMMAAFADTVESSPIHRGVFLARGVLGRSLRPPPEAFAPLAPDLHPDLTTRERVTLQTKSSKCMTCHAVINPLGFALERFDAVGRYREVDRDKPIDDSGSYQTGAGKTVELSGARQLAEFVARSDEGRAAFAEQLFHHLVQQPAGAYGPTTLEELKIAFASHDFNVRQLAVETMISSVFARRTTETAASNQPAKP
jgi:cytochrome c553